jgi:5-methyltetrahydropteroyltriglutamate--homocysteine methyltransferase
VLSALHCANTKSPTIFPVSFSFLLFRQIHEPVFATSTGPALQRDAEKVYAALAATGVPLNIVIPFDDVEEKVYQYLVKLPVAALGLDFLSVPGNTAGNRMAQLIATYGFPKDKCLGAGVIDGRSVWADDGTAARIVAALRDLLGKDQSICVQVTLVLAP